jgi:hypothetical protein
VQQPSLPALTRRRSPGPGHPGRATADGPHPPAGPAGVPAGDSDPDLPEDLPAMPAAPAAPLWHSAAAAGDSTPGRPGAGTVGGTEEG